MVKNTHAVKSAAFIIAFALSTTLQSSDAVAESCRNYDYDRCEFSEVLRSKNPTLFPNEGRCSIVVASRKTLREVTIFLKDITGYEKDVNIYRSTNGWYAITVGTHDIDQGWQRVDYLKRQDLIPQDSLCSQGENYIAHISIGEKPKLSSITTNSQSSSSAKRSRKVNCDKSEEEVAACYALTVGPKACSQYVSENHVPLADTYAKRVAVSSACAGALKESFAEDFLPSDIVEAAFDEMLESGCNKINSDNIFAQLFVGMPFCVTNMARWAQKIDLANSCARNVEAICGR